MKRPPPLKYLVVIERSSKGYGAYVPDLPGCVAVADSSAEVEGLIQVAIEAHIAGLREDGLKVPRPRSRSGYVAPRIA